MHLPDDDFVRWKYFVEITSIKSDNVAHKQPVNTTRQKVAPSRLSLQIKSLTSARLC